MNTIDDAVCTEPDGNEEVEGFFLNQYSVGKAHEILLDLQGYCPWCGASYKAQSTTDPAWIKE